MKKKRCLKISAHVNFTVWNPRAYWISSLERDDKMSVCPQIEPVEWLCQVLCNESCVQSYFTPNTNLYGQGFLYCQFYYKEEWCHFSSDVTLSGDNVFRSTVD